MNILITGIKGTIGTALKAELLRRGHTVYGVDLQHGRDPNYYRADVGNYRQLKEVFNRRPFFNVVYHLAAEFGRLNGEEFYDTLWQTNVVGTRNLLELQRGFGFKLIFASSSEIYGETSMVEWWNYLTEDLSERRPLRQHNDYAISKYVNEQQIMNFAERYGNECVRLRFFNAYGPGEYYHAYRSVACLFAYRALHELPYEVYENYHRVFMFMDDFIPTLANVCENFKAGEVYNIGGNEYRSVRELSDLVLDEIEKLGGVVGRDRQAKRITYLPEDKHNVTSKRPDCTKAARDFGHAPKVTLEEGIPKTIAWMREVYGL